MPTNSIRSACLGAAAMLAGLSLGLSGCGDVSAAIGGQGFKAKAKAARIEGDQLRPGQVGGFLQENADDRIRFIAYKVLEQHRVRLRSGTDQWSPLDLVSMEEETMRDMDSSYAPLAKAARAQYIWTRLEGMEPGELAGLIRSEYNLELIAWIVDWEREGRPHLEGRLNRKDLEAVQTYAMARLPSARYLLRWSFEQDRRPGQVAGFLSRDWTDQQLVEILRMWCTSEGWSPLARGKQLEASEQQAVDATIARLEQSRDPLVRREAVRWKSWMVKRGNGLALR